MSIPNGPSDVADAVIRKAIWYRTNKFDQRKPETLAVLRPQAAQTQSIADSLPHVRRMSYGDDYLDLVAKTADISTENVVGAMSYVNLPEERFWIQGPYVSREAVDGSDSRFSGAMITQNPDRGFTFDLVNCHDGIKGFNAISYGIRPTISPTNGIHLDDDQLLEMIENYQRVDRNNQLKHDALIDHYYNAADFFCRLFVLMNSTNIGNNFNGPKTKDEIELEQLNIRRKRMNRPPILSTRPIIIDPTTTDARLFDPTSKISIEEFLGKTKVRPSKFITRPDGSLWIRKRDNMPWFRKGHERKVRSEVDRTSVNVPLILAAPGAADATIEFMPDRPLIVRTPGKIGGANADK